MKLHTKILSLVLAAALLLCMPTALRRIEEQLYPCRYAGVVESYAAEYEMDPLLIYTFVRTESSFDPEAVSSVGARGLMQMTEDTFEWIKSKIAPDEPLTFDDLFDPACAVGSGRITCACAWTATAGTWPPPRPPITAAGARWTAC